MIALLAAYLGLAALVNGRAHGAGEWSGVGVRLNQVLLYLRPDALEEVAHVAKKRKISAQGVVTLVQIVRSNLPVDCGEAYDADGKGGVEHIVGQNAKRKN